MLGSKILFLGGVYGVGKTTLSKKACVKIGIKHLSASRILDWKRKEKEVDNPAQNQKLLIQGLKLEIKKGQTYLLDGHFCLPTKKQEIYRVPLKVFKTINPVGLVVIKGNANRIKRSLEERDKIGYDVDWINRLQNSERIHARGISDKLSLRYLEYDASEFLKKLDEIESLIYNK